MIKGRENNNINNNNNNNNNNSKAIVKLKAQPPSDLLVCFPTRAHLSLKPKPISSPSRPNCDPNKRHLRRLTTRAATSSGAGPGSPHVWSKDNQIRGGGPEMSEPTSPKVTCAGQIKVRPRSSNTNCRNWQSVMEEIEKIHNSRAKCKKKSSFGIKKDVMSFLTCLRSLRFDFHCFGSFPQQILSSDEEDDDDDDEEDEVAFDEAEDEFKEIIDDNDFSKGKIGINNDDDNNNNAVFSKWFMVLQENQSNNNDDNNNKLETEEIGNDDFTPAVPPPNALLLMRCRSAPAKSWLEEKEDEEKIDKQKSEDEDGKIAEEKEEDDEKEEKIKKKRETLAIVMKYDTDFYKLSTDVAQETWVVGEFKDPFSRSRSWRR